MIHSAFDPMDIAGLHQWMQQQAGDNRCSISCWRGVNSSVIARDRLCSSRCRRWLFYYEKLNMAQIAGRLGVNKSTVSRTLCRARHRLHHILQYSL